MTALRELMRDVMLEHLLINCTHLTLGKAAAEIGLPPLPLEGTKRQKLEDALSRVPDNELPKLGERFLEVHSLHPGNRNRFQDAVWAVRNYPEVPKRFRRELARSLTGPIYRDAGEFLALLNRLWLLDDIPTWMEGTAGQSLRSRIDRHVIRNPDDWETEMLFDEVGAFAASDRRFALFIEGLASAAVLTDERAQRAFVDTANQALRRCGVELREVGEDGGYPVFQVTAISGAPTRRPKNLIFASSVKPDLRLTNALDNDIEIASNADRVLVYERPIGDGGLTWNDLQAWWQHTRNISTADEAKRSLYARLKDSLPSTSPPQQHFYESYHRHFGRDIPNLPALLPEVWLHWDHKTVEQRGIDALFRFRMDFLMLLPNRVRVVLEIDGKHHFADADGKASPSLYAKMAFADRDLRLAGYEVYRFGAVELLAADTASRVVSDFFDALFERHRIAHSAPSRLG